MFLRILLGGIVASLFAMVITLSVVNTSKTRELDARLAKATKELKAKDEAITKLREEMTVIAEGAKGKAGPGGAPAWSYEGDTGPEHWAKAYPTCGAGKNQSPVNIAGPFEKATVTLKPEYKAGVLKVVNTGRTIQVNLPPGSALKVGNEAYELVHIQFHRPSQHQVDGKPMAMQAYLVHKNAEGKLVVIGVLMRESAVQNRTLWAIWKNMPAKEGPEVEVPSVSINPSNLLPESLAHYAYEGSLSAPPCTEGVRYFIMKAPIGIQKEMIDGFPFKNNARPVQPLNGRKIQAS